MLVTVNYNDRIFTYNLQDSDDFVITKNDNEIVIAVAEKSIDIDSLF